MFIGSWVADWLAPFSCDKPAFAQFVDYSLFLLLLCIALGYLTFYSFGRRIKVDSYNKVFSRMRLPWFTGLFVLLLVLLIICYAQGLSTPCAEGRLPLIGAIFVLFVLEGIIGSIIFIIITGIKAPAKVKYTSLLFKFIKK